MEESISEAKDEVAEELQLASEQEAHSFRRLLSAEVQENRDFRSQQMLARQLSEAREIEKSRKEAGNLNKNKQRV